MAYVSPPHFNFVLTNVLFDDHPLDQQSYQKTVEAAKVRGPITFQSIWRSRTLKSTSGASIHRNGVRV
jgi:hypothetical protein